MAIYNSVIWGVYGFFCIEFLKNRIIVMILPTIIFATIIFGICYWCRRVFKAYMACMKCIDNVVYTYYLLNVKRCRTKADGFGLEFDESEMPDDEEPTFKEELEYLVNPLFQAYMDNSIIVDTKEDSFIPHFHKEKLLMQLKLLLDNCGDVLMEYTTLDFPACWLLMKKYTSLVNICDALENKRLQINEMSDEIVCFFSKDMES